MKIFAPASIGNFSVGFDLLGLAIQPIDGYLLGDCVEITADQNDRLIVSSRFDETQLPDNADNLAHKARKAFANQMSLIDNPMHPVCIRLEKNLPIGSGLGSSAASIVATLVALNHHFEQPFTAAELLEMAGKMEAKVSGSVHYDNVAPCLLGGLQFMTNHSIAPASSIPIPDNWFIVLAYPEIRIDTSQAREILPAEIPLETAIKYAQNLSAFIDCMHNNQPSMAVEFLFDVIAEPYRKNLIPKYDHFRDFARTVGALGTGISGSGPTVFALCDNLQTAERISAYAKTKFCDNQGFVHVCQPDLIGARIIDAN